MRIKRIAGCVIALILVPAAKADESPWYVSAKSAYLFGEGDATLIGTTASAYGGFPTIGIDDGVQISIAAGRRIPNGWRIEAELGFLELDTDDGLVAGLDDRMDDTFRLDGSINSTVLMFNTLIDLDMSERFTPYLKAGIGIARNEASATLDVDYNSAMWEDGFLEGQSVRGMPFPHGYDTSFAWNMGIGVRTALTDRFLLALEFGVIDLGEAVTGIDGNSDAITFSDLESQRLSLGLNFQF